jgi:DNA-binding MarR family transcriptional regulator
MTPANNSDARRESVSTIDELRIAGLRERFPDVDFSGLDVALAVGRASVALDRSLAEIVRPHDLTPVGLQTLISVFLADGGTLSLSDLGQQLRVTRANVSLVLAQLEKRKLIRRKPDPGDGRKLRATLTKAGERLLASVIPAAVDAIHAALAPLSKTDRARLKTLAQRVGEPRQSGDRQLARRKSRSKVGKS